MILLLERWAMKGMCTKLECMNDSKQCHLGKQIDWYHQHQWGMNFYCYNVLVSMSSTSSM